MINLRLVPFFFIAVSAPAAALAEPVCVTTYRANLRQGPGETFPVTWTVAQNMPLMRVDKKGSWSQVEDLDGQKHWITTSAISSKVSCLVVKTKTAKLRQGPSSRHPLAELAFVDRYTPFRKVAREDAWLQVQDEFKGRYWVNETNVWIPLSRAHISF